MELPFALNDEPEPVIVSAASLPTSSHEYQNVNVSNNMHVKVGQSTTTAADSNLIASSHSNLNVRGTGVGGGVQSAAIGGYTTATTSSTTSSSVQHQPASATSNLLHRVALYDNIHPHFYAPKVLGGSSSLASTRAGNASMNHANGSSARMNMGNMTTNGVATNSNVNLRQSQHQYSNISSHGNNIKQQQLHHQQQAQQYPYQPRQIYQKQQQLQQQQPQQSILDIDDFVTIRESDANSLEDDAESIHTPSISILQEQYGGYSNVVYHPQQQQQQQHHHLSISKTTNYGQSHMDVLSLLLSSATAPITIARNDTDEIDNDNDNAKESETDHSSSIVTSEESNGLVQLCEVASRDANLASISTREGRIADAVKYHVSSAKAYKDAAILLKRDHDNHFNLLAFSLLGLSNAQARIASTLVKHGGVKVRSLGDGDSNNLIGSSSNKNGDDDKASGNDGNGKGKDAKGRPVAVKTVGKEDRLRAKIRASMETAEADMTQSTFLGSASTASIHTNTNTNTNRNSNPKNRANITTATDKTVTHVAPQQQTQGVNPVDDMMELEKELRDMDATLNMGVNLSASTSSIATKTSHGEGSYCVVPGAGGQSYMSSSMMWASGIGIGGGSRQVGGNQQHHGAIPGRARGNRVQSIAGLQRSPSVGSHQQLHQQNHPKHQHQHQQNPGLESSWWGQASALASSTTSLSNSMVGIRSGNHGYGGMGGNSGGGGAPANTKQLMRLLDTLKTLGDENASLMREVEEAKKARTEAKAARETMRQFKEEYGKRFSTLKAALDKFRSEYPDQRGGASNSNQGSSKDIVSKSNFVRNSTASELQKRDKMIQKLSNDLKKKDDALRKYENFYKEVKARSEQKKKQKEEQLRKSKK